MINEEMLHHQTNQLGNTAGCSYRRGDKTDKRNDRTHLTKIFCRRVIPVTVSTVGIIPCQKVYM